MSIVLDTCALLWWSLDPKAFSESAVKAIKQMEREKNGITPSIITKDSKIRKFYPRTIW